MGFPNDFVWGVASASYQIEGGACADGKGPSIWDHFSHIPGKTFNGHTGDVAADAYHRFEEDLDLMKDLGIQNYRFSMSWPRLFPDGKTGPWSPPGDPSGLNRAGLDYYDRLVNGCLSRGITPWLTLFHWDLPLFLSRKGGWLNRETAYDFASYAEFVAAHFQGRISRFITINEPQCIIGLGLGNGLHAPGLKLDDGELFSAWHNLLLAHGLAVSGIRKHIPDAAIGIASTGSLTYLAADTFDPESDSFSPDLCGSERLPSGYPVKTPAELPNGAFLSLPPDENPGYYFNHQWFLDPLIFGHYPNDPRHPWMPYVQSAPAEDLQIISAPIDFVGLNAYNGHELLPDSGYSFAEKYPGYPRTAMKWPVTPEVLYWGPRLIWERYQKPVFITENGLSCNDKIFLDGKVHDPDRIDFLHRYLKELQKTTTDSIPVGGYFQWAFTDNYEWNFGYDERFGLIYIDYRDCRRIPKDSAYWYRDVIKSNGDQI